MRGGRERKMEVVVEKRSHDHSVRSDLQYSYVQKCMYLMISVFIASQKEQP